MKSDVEVFVLENKEKAARFAAELIASEIKDKKLNLGLASGETMIPVYNELVTLYRKGSVSLSNAKTFSIDEYLGVRRRDSFRFFLEKNFLSKVNVKKENQSFVDGSCRDYENKIKKSGGIDLMILGIGVNGHIAFNEPGSSVKSRARKIKLSYETRISKRKFFKSLKEVPNEAVTLGIANILDARKVFLIAFGKDKARAVGDTLNERVSERVPASTLQLNRSVSFVVDKSAASNLRFF